MHNTCAYIIRMDKKLPRKKAVNLLVETELLDEARKAEINLSAAFKKALRRELAKKWTEENQDAIRAYNERLEREGVWNEEFRSW